MPPYPVNVTAQMLDCFSEKYDLPEKKVTDVDELPIGYIAEELWIYSKSVELLTEPEDACYLAAQTQDIQLNIYGNALFIEEQASGQKMSIG
mgnify:CR=1 FL=1